jgi:uncharacterized repeat protein (TIGR02543 family)
MPRVPRLHPERIARLRPAACLLAYAALLLACAASDARADCKVTYAIASQWTPGFNASVAIQNTGTTPVSGWTLSWTFAGGQQVTQLWNGVATQSGAQVTVKNAAYNATIPAGGSVSFGFNGTWSGANAVPTTFTLNGAVCGGGSTPTSYTLTVAAVGSGSTTPAAGSYSYAAGTTVTVSATPAAGATFTGWSGAATGSTTPVTLTMNGDRSLTATFSGGTTAGIHYAGRVVATDPSAVKLGWQGAGIVATVRGSTIAVKLRSEGDVVFYQPVIDGVAGARFSVASGAEQSVTLATGLTSAEHQVELYRETEGWATATFLGFTSGTVTGAPAWNGRLLELVGDSITAGYGDLGSELHPNWVANPACHYTPDNSSWYATYGAVAGRALGAEVSSIAHSGWGLYYDRGGDTRNTMPTVYDQALSSGGSTTWTFTPEPQAVVVNLGTNDTAAPAGFPSASYTAAGVAFAQHLRARYPNAWIVFTIGPMLNQTQLDAVDAAQAAIVKARKAAGDARIASFDLGIQNLGSNGEVASGCDWHPSVAEHQRMGAVLKAKLQALLGW